MHSLRFTLILILALSLSTLALPALAGGRHANEDKDALSQKQLSEAGAHAMTKAQILDFIRARKGLLKGRFNNWQDSLRFYDDGTVKGETSGSSGRAMSGSGSWGVDEDGTLHLSIRWEYVGSQQSSGKLFQHGNSVYQVDSSDMNRPWLYRFLQ